jgi:uncharacterized protein YjbJ (UPF0337 family)
MSTEDKAKNLADKAAGSIKETTGKVKGDESLRREGKADQAKADLRQSGEKIKDALRDVSDRRP